MLKCGRFPMNGLHLHCWYGVLDRVYVYDLQNFAVCSKSSQRVVEAFIQFCGGRHNVQQRLIPNVLSMLEYGSRGFYYWTLPTSPFEYACLCDGLPCMNTSPEAVENAQAVESAINSAAMAGNYGRLYSLCCKEKTPYAFLTWAISMHHLNDISLLLREHSFSSDQQNCSLDWAIRAGHLDTFSLLQNTFHKEILQWLPLHAVAQSNSLEIVKLFDKECGMDKILPQDFWREFRFVDLSILKWVRHKTPVTQQYWYYPRNVPRGGLESSYAWLVDNGYRPQAQDLVYAVETGNLDLVCAMNEKGYPFSLLAFQSAVAFRYLSIVRWLYSQFPPKVDWLERINIWDRFIPRYYSPVHYYRDSFENVVKYLLSIGWKPTESDVERACSHPSIDALFPQ